MSPPVEIATDVHRVETPLGARSVCCYVLAGSERTVLVDTATAPAMRTTVLAELERVARPGSLLTVVVTHADFDHMGGNRVLRERRPDAVFACHAADAPLVGDVARMCTERYDEFAADHGIGQDAAERAWVVEQAQDVMLDAYLCEGQRIELGDGWHVEVLHVPGHSPGHVALHDPRSGTVILGDAVMADALPDAAGAPAFAPTYRDADATLATVERLAGLDAERLLTGHFPVMEGAERDAFLTASRDFVVALDGELRELLVGAAGPLVLRDLVDALSPVMGAWPAEAAPALAWPLAGHLDRLAADGCVTCARDARGRVTWTWAA